MMSKSYIIRDRSNGFDESKSQNLHNNESSWSTVTLQDCGPNFNPEVIQRLKENPYKDIENDHACCVLM